MRWDGWMVGDEVGWMVDGVRWMSDEVRWMDGGG